MITFNPRPQCLDEAEHGVINYFFATHRRLTAERCRTLSMCSGFRRNKLVLALGNGTEVYRKNHKIFIKAYIINRLSSVQLILNILKSNV